MGKDFEFFKTEHCKPIAIDWENSGSPKYELMISMDDANAKLNKEGIIVRTDEPECPDWNSRTAEKWALSEALLICARPIEKEIQTIDIYETAEKTHS